MSVVCHKIDRADGLKYMLKYHFTLIDNKQCQVFEKTKTKTKKNPKFEFKVTVHYGLRRKKKKNQHHHHQQQQRKNPTQLWSLNTHLQNQH